MVGGQILEEKVEDTLWIEIEPPPSIFNWYVWIWKPSEEMLQ